MSRNTRLVSMGRARGGRDNHATPSTVYSMLDSEFSFTLDPCPLDPMAGTMFGGADGLARSWGGERVFCNPPYSNIAPWLSKAREAAIAVYLLPARTDTRWWHEQALLADEVRFIRGRLRFGAAKGDAPFPSVVLVYRTAREAREGEKP